MFDIRRSFRARLGFVTLAVQVIVGVVATAFITADALRTAQEGVGARLADLATYVSDTFDWTMFERVREIRVSASQVILIHPESPISDKRELLELVHANHSDFAWIGLTDASGTVVASTGGLLEGADVSQQPWFINAQEGPWHSDVYVADSQTSLLPNPSNEPLRLIDIAAPVYSADGALMGVLGAHLKWSWTEPIRNTFISEVHSTEAIDVIVLSADGDVLLAPEHVTATSLSTLESFRIASDADRSSVIETWPDQERYAVGVVKAAGFGEYPGLGWIVLARQSTDIAFAPLFQVQRRLILIGLLAGGAIGAAVWLYSSRIVQPIVNLSRASKQISSDDYSVIIPVHPGQDEIATLAQSLHDLVNTLVQHIGQLTLSSERFRAMNRIDRATLAAKQVDEAAWICVDFFKSHWDIASASIVAFGDDTREATVLADYAASGSGLSTGTAVTPNASALEAIHDNGTLVVDELARLPVATPSTAADLSRPGRVAYVAPMFVQGQLAGLFTVVTDRNRATDPENIRIVNEFSSQMAVALQQERYRLQIAQHIDQLETRVQQRTAELLQAKNRIEAIYSSTSNAVATADCDGVINTFNPAFVRTFQLAEQNIDGRRVTEFAEADSRSVLESTLRKVCATGEPRTVSVVLQRDGYPFEADVAISPVLGADDLRGIVFGVRDVTERNRLERALQASEEMYRRFLDLTPYPIVVINSTGEIVRINERLTTSLGHKVRDLIGKPVEILLPARDREQYTALRREYMHAPDTVVLGVNESFRALHQDGREIEVEIGLSPIILQGERMVLIQIVDVTAHRLLQRSLELAVERERELNDLKSRFISMVAHEYKTPLAVILSSVGLIRDYSDRLSAERKANLLDTISVQVEELTALLNDTLTLTRHEDSGTVFSPEPVDLIEIVSALVDEIQLTCLATHRIEFTHRGQCQSIMIDLKLCRGALTNLLSNAVKYSPQGGSVFVDVECGESEASISVRDTGIGIPQADQARIFETFHRAHNVENISGTGLGLVIAKQSVEAHGGTISFESVEGEGTTFTIRLPVMKDPPKNRSERQ
ncbi:MAG: PAS domain S-box protein [Chloroflexi bacterium]|nr:PAS domain S-box protein [Chloroflexota bacterium]